MTRKYTAEHKEFIATHVEGRSTAQLTELFNERFGLNVTETAMKSYKANNKLKSGMPVGRHEPPKELVEKREFVSAHAEGRTNEEMTMLFNEHFGLNWTVNQVKAFKHRNKISSGLTGRFEKGSVPFNKGKKGVGGWEPTQFKKGNKPFNYKPVGTERVNGDDYVDIKVADPNKWKGKHIIVWEEANGRSVSKGEAIIFGDGNRRNFDPDNLILVSRSQLAMLNKYKLIQQDADLTKTGLIVADIFLKMGERKRAQ